MLARQQELPSLPTAATLAAGQQVTLSTSIFPSFHDTPTAARGVKLQLALAPRSSHPLLPPLCTNLLYL